MAAASLDWGLERLDNLAISTLVNNFSRLRKDIKILPDNVLFDVYYKLYNKGRLCNLSHEFSDLETFSRVLKVADKRNLLHNCFQAVMDHGQAVSLILSEAYSQLCCVASAGSEEAINRVIQLGFNLGGFFSDAGWYYHSENVFSACLQLCKQKESLANTYRALECCTRLLYVRNANCKYKEAESAWTEAQRFLEVLDQGGQPVCKSNLFSEYCAFLFATSLYDKAYSYCNQALQEVTPTMPPRALVDTFRQCSKACVVKREFTRAGLLIRYAVNYAKERFGEKHPKYADTLLDYGFYLLNIDSIDQAVEVYQAALDIRMTVFGGFNLHVAVAHEDLAYSSYVHEYSTGRFNSAREHAEIAIEMITRILPKDHLSLASSKRVKALILEEIAIDNGEDAIEKKLLEEAEELHRHSLTLAMRAFGENNVQTAKHFGNLGRLYQSMRKFEEAEKMHLKAIKIKERLLGNEDYEVALSVGHLASLYNYDMMKFDEAEKLYRRSIRIGKKLFGDGYSGLEYDYRGLLRLYQEIGNIEKVNEYSNVLHEWATIRGRVHSQEKKPFDFKTFENVDSVLEQYFKLT